jgi:hypothetical protein
MKTMERAGGVGGDAVQDKKPFLETRLSRGFRVCAILSPPENRAYRTGRVSTLRDALEVGDVEQEAVGAGLDQA